MRPGLALAAALFALLAAAAIATVEVSTDAAAVFGPSAGRLDALETPAGREVVVALPGPPDLAADAASAVAAALKDDPQVARVRIGPAPPSDAFVDWIWAHRFRLSPPEPADLTPGALAARLETARGAMLTAEGAAFGEYFLRDPTGSFARLIERMRAAAPEMESHRGVWRAKTGDAALIFIALAPRPFEAGETAALAARIRAAAREAGVAARLLNPRIIAAEVSAETTRASQISVAAASAFLLVWLLATLRSVRATALVLLPLGVGAASGALALQAVFGEAHVVALGFGGALLGLGLDYPIHIASHPEDRARMRRIVLTGAATTAVAFLAMLGSGVPALAQTGVFIAVGLAVAALAACAVPAATRPPRAPRLAWRLPRATPAALLLAAVAVLAAIRGGPPNSLADLPDRIAEDIAEVARMVDLPSARFALIVEGADLDALLEREAALIPVLEAAIAAGELEGYEMLAETLRPGAAPPTPPEATFAAGLSRAALAPEFAARQRAEYAAAAAAAPLSAETLQALPEFAALAARVETGPSGWREIAPLYGPTPALAERVAAAAPPGVRWADLAAPVTAKLAEIQDKALTSLGLGAIAAFALLAAVLRDLRVAGRIALVSGATALTAAAIMASLAGGLQIFQIIALTLLVGISVDYGLLAGLARDKAAREGARVSIAVCSGSTLIAFLVMTASPVKILHEIGLTVAVGVALIAALSISELEDGSGA